ncbi:hypothetical protein J4E81_010747 [Alternaria sp. BMP 2799]|nr:hypothetical protein J4E81_010747 [Alternaria sp. BMP 2799]
MPHAANSDDPTLTATHVAVREARSLANEATLSQLTSMVSHDSAADISEVLKREATAYPRLVNELAVAFNSSPINETHNKDHQPSVATGLLDLPVDGTVEVTHSLDQSVLGLSHAIAECDKVLSHIPKEMAAAFNQLIRGGKILFQLHETFVVEIGPSHVVKVALSLDPDHIDNIQYVATHVPELPIPDCLGVLRNLSATQKTSVQEQLNSLFQHLRTPTAEDSGSGGEVMHTEHKVVRVSAIIDWEAAGWYPESWEFVKAVSMIDPCGPLSDWIDFLPTDAIGYFPMEFSIDRLLDQWLG